MSFKELAKRIGIAEYPAEMDKIYAELPAAQGPVCDLKVIDQLQQEHDLFGEYYDIVRKTAQVINTDQDRSTWIRVVLGYVKDRMACACREVPVPTPDGTDVTSLLPLYIHIPQIPGAIASYRSRGFSEEEIAALLTTYKRDLRVVENSTGRPGLNLLYFRWLNRFSKATIFNTEGLQFEIRNLPSMTVYLRNKETGKVLPVLAKGVFHASGVQRLGARGYEDSEGSFEAKFYEDEQNYYGHPSVDCVVAAEVQTFPKNQWEKVAGPGDECLGMHIPKNADISPEQLDKAFASAKKIARERYPEYKTDMIFCGSWLLDPILTEILGPNSRIAGFSSRFARYPGSSNGMMAYGHVFHGKYENFEDLPENTSLQRGLKQRYLKGLYTNYYSGLIV